MKYSYLTNTKMKLFSDKGNFHSLKLISIAEEYGIALEFIEKKHGEKVVQYLSSHSLPVLEVYSNKFLFAPNAASRYLSNLKKLEDDCDVDRWIEWESVQLQPLLFPYLVSLIGTGKPDTELLLHIQSLLKLVNAELKGKKFLSDIGLSAADFIVWASLLPLLSGKFELKGWESLYPKLKTWFASMCDLKSCQKAINLVLPNGDTSYLKESLLSQPVPLSLMHVQASEKQDKLPSLKKECKT